MNSEEAKEFGLEERTYKFAKNCRDFIKKLPKIAANFKDSDQLIKSSGSVAANFIESIEILSQKDKLYRTKICRKEAKESHLWLRLLDVGGNPELEKEKAKLAKESHELTKIFGSIVYKKQSKQS